MAATAVANFLQKGNPLFEFATSFVRTSDVVVQ